MIACRRWSGRYHEMTFRKGPYGQGRVPAIYMSPIYVLVETRAPRYCPPFNRSREMARRRRQLERIAL
jgi:hypothetical protein